MKMLIKWQIMHFLVFPWCISSKDFLSLQYFRTRLQDIVLKQLDVRSEKYLELYPIYLSLMNFYLKISRQKWIKLVAKKANKVKPYG